MNGRTHIIPVPISAEGVSRFLDYFNVALMKLKFVNGHGEYLPDGGFREEAERVMIIPPDVEFVLTWTITLNANGTLDPVKVSVDETAPEGWQTVAEALIRETLVSIVNNARNKFFQRYLFAYIGWPLDGEYYINVPGLRIAPSQPASGWPFGHSEEVLIIDLNAEGVSALDAWTLGKVQAKKFAALLSVFLNVGLYEIPNMESRCFYTQEGETKHLQLGYKSSIPKPAKMPRKGAECSPGRACQADRSKMEDIMKSGSPRQLLHCPSDIRVLFRAFNALPPNEQAAYLGAASLFQIALSAGRHYPTVQMAYAVAAVDAMSLAKEHNMRAFIELVRDYCPELPESDVEHCYQKLRSAHFHEGALPGGEYEPVYSVTMLMLGRDDLRRYTKPRFVSEAMRTVLIRWLLRRAPASGEESAGSNEIAPDK